MIVVPAIAVAAIGSWAVRALALEETIAASMETVFLALFVGSLVGLSVVYYAFKLDVQSG